MIITKETLKTQENKTESLWFCVVNPFVAYKEQCNC